MLRRFSSILDDCLEAVRAGEPLESVIERYPKHAERLRIYLPLAARVSRTPQHQARTGARAAAWDGFRVRAEDMRLGRKPPITINWGWLRPAAIAAALVLALFGAMGGTAYASQDALPDSPLYRVKLATEDARVWLAFSETKKADILLDQSNERTDEIMAMLRDGKDVPGNVLTAMRNRNARAVRILEDHPAELGLLTRAKEQAAEQEGLLLELWGAIAESARDDYSETVATLHNAQLRTTGTPGSVSPEDLALGVIRISGSAEPVGESVWLLGGVQVTLDARARGATTFEAGQSVRIIAARGADGRLLALNVALDAEQPEPKYVVAGEIEDIGENEVIIAGQRIALTERTLLKLKLQRGQQVEIEVENVGGQAVASSVEGSEGDVSDSPLLAYEGIIENERGVDAGVSSDWVVSGQQFTVTSETDIDARSGALTNGMRARVEAVVKDDKAVAKRIVVLGKDEEQAAVRVEGVLERGDDETWTVSGVEVQAPADQETPAVGSLVTLEGRRQEKKLVTERVFTAFKPGPRGFAFLRGPIGVIGEDGLWQVGLVPVAVDEETVVRGNPGVGQRAFVWGKLDDEGRRIEAVFVSVLDRTPRDR